jgi:hypothetical protein
MNQTFNIHGLPVSIDVSDPALAGYIDERLRPFASSDTPLEQPFQIRMSETMRVDETSDHYIELHKRAFWNPEANRFRLHVDGAQLTLGTSTPWQMDAVTRGSFLEGEGKRQKRYAAIFENAICAPIFMQLLLRWNIIAIPGSVIKKGSKGILIVGLDEEQRQHYTSELGRYSPLLSTRTILTDGERIFPFPEGNETETAAIPIDSLHFLVRSKTNGLYPLHAEQAYHMLRSTIHVLRQTPETGVYASLVFADPTRWQALFDNDSETLKKLCERTQSYKFLFSG